ncbi:LysR family transcriptional regulator [Alkalilimnicola ehrlichii]|uniref:LysR family transcriptional regulator n=1 Tax=Alkalilimnicola ehrlichii TaxID=351052 RepID=A0A3E0WIT6_9GAMM|nr:LysR substrate-binding domain-containing protein [Alkalilimnicola ehrlichii]RFA26598.1 LysR family transcriptional regulator [Alkalilimnicola ehrlichii]RFA31876.1 LysR family transcriptional regulator [Alkalilimnicola ehrlichii]
MFGSLPLAALRTFESAARLRSFKAAAEDLAVTPTAVSHQVRRLEQQLGVALFRRVARGVEVTEAGERLFRSLHGALLDISHAFHSLRPQPDPAGLVITTTHSFAALWLVPRLGRFYRRHPELSLRLDTNPAPLDLQQDASVDVAIRYGDKEYPDLHQVGGLAESFGAYCAPQLAPAGKQLPAALLTVRWHNSMLYDRAWERWCLAAGADWLSDSMPVHAYEEENYALQAAIAGQGMVLASSILVSDTLRNGLLIAYRPEVQVPGARYTVLCKPGRERHPPVRAFLDWLREEL